MQNEHGVDAPCLHRALFAAWHLAVTVRDAVDFRLLDANIAAARLYGYDTREALLQSGRPLGSADARDPFFRIVAEAVREGEARGEVVSYRVDGTPFPMEVRASVIEFGGTRYLQTLLDDITDRKLAEQAARRRAEQDALIARVSRSFVAGDANEAVGVALELLSVFLGARRAAIGACADRTLVVTPEREWWLEPRKAQYGAPLFVAQDVIEDLSQGKAYLRDARTDDRAAHGAILAVPLTTAGQVTGWLALSRDDAHTFSNEDIALVTLVAEIIAIGRGRALTDRALARAKEEAVAASQTKSAFLANMSHELRTPLNGVIGMVDLLAQTSLDERQRRFALVAKSSASLLLSVINDILDFSKIEAGKLDMDEADFTVDKLVEEVASLFEAPAEEKGIDLCCECTGATGPLIGAVARIRQVLVNLVSNAVKFTDAGEVVLRANTQAAGDDVTVRFEVHDTGIGMSRDARLSLFKPFHQVDASSTRAHGGSGLGLAISRGLVARMGGQISVESEPGRGSIFSVTLRLRRSSVAPEPLDGAIASLAGVRVVCVDDNATNREILANHLGAAGMKCDTFADAASALGALAREATAGHPYAFAIVDHHMPVMDGVELVRRMRAEASLREVRVMMLGSAIVPLEPKTQLDLGIAYYGTKPIWRGHLLRTIAAILAGDTAMPRPAQLEPREEPPPPMRAPRAGAKILLVEDSPINAEVGGEILRGAGYEYDLVTDGQEAIDAFMREPYALVLMDCQLPEVDGYEAARRIRALEKDKGGKERVPILALTASAQRGDLERCMEAGMDDHIAKPFDARHLLATIAARLRPGSPASTKPSETSETHEKVDLARALDRLSGNRGLLVRIVRQFIGIVPDARAALRAAMEARDPKRLAFVSHRLRGQAASFDARALVLAVENLEGLARSANWALAAPALALVETELLDACAALTAFLGAG